MCKWFPGLHDACTRAAVRTQHIACHNLNFVPFREENHDTIELGHMYNIVVTADDGTVSRYCEEYGYRALVSATGPPVPCSRGLYDTDGGAS